MQPGDRVWFNDGKDSILWATVVRILPGGFLEIDPDSHPGHLGLLMIQQVLGVLGGKASNI